MELTNANLLQMHRALTILGNRRMATLGADLKVARLLAVLKPLVEPLESVKRKAALALVDQMPEGTELTAMQEQILNMRSAEVQSEIDTATVEVELPMAYVLKEADLPREQTSKDGWVNGSQLGAIIADLGILYVMDEAK